MDYSKEMDTGLKNVYFLYAISEYRAKAHILSHYTVIFHLFAQCLAYDNLKKLFIVYYIKKTIMPMNIQALM